MSQQLLSRYDLYGYSHYYVSMLYIVPATTTSSYPYCYSNYTSLWPTLLQQLTHLYDPYRYYDPWSILLWQLLRHSAKYCYSNSYIFMVSIGTTTTLSPWTILTALTSIGALLRNHYVAIIYTYSYYITMIHTISTITTQAPYYSNYEVPMTNTYSSYVTKLYTVTTTNTPLRPHITANIMSPISIICLDTAISTTIIQQWLSKLSCP